jgi:hypothetical protein
MRRKMTSLAVSVLTSIFLMISGGARAEATDPDAAHLKAGHKKIDAVVTDVKSGIYTVKTPTGTYTLSENAALRHGHGQVKEGDEMTLWVNENNMVIDAHPKGQVSKAHRVVSGKLKNLDNVKSELRLLTPQGEKTFKVKPETRGFSDIAEGSPVTIELNEAGEVIDVHKDQG